MGPANKTSMTQVQTATSQTTERAHEGLPVGRSVSLDQAARLLNVSRRTIYNRIKDGQLATVRAGGSQRVLVASLHAFARQS
jgi:excisionase family DNA binding protein